MRSIIRKGPSGEDGIALVVAMAVVMLVTIMVVTVTTIAIFQSGATGRDRQRSAAVASAEGQVDALAAEVSRSAPADLPCTDAAGLPQTDDAQVGRDDLDSTSRVSYFDADQDPISCADVAAGAPAAYAAITATTTAETIGQGIPARRTVETMLRLTPLYSSKLDMALYSKLGIAIGNNGDILDSVDGPSDVFTTGIIRNDAGGNQVVEGSLLSMSDITWDKQLTVKGDVWANGDVELTHSSGNGGVLVTGRVRAVGPHPDNDADPGVPPDVIGGGHVVLSNKVTVQKSVEAGVDVQWPACGETCSFPVTVPKVTDPGFPPIASSSVSDWETNGYVVEKRFGSGGDACGMATNKLDNAGAWLAAEADDLDQPTILVSTCAEPVTIVGSDLVLDNDLAVFSRSGFKFASTTMSGNSATPANDPRLLYFIQPVDATCSGDGITVNSGFDASSRIKVLLFSNCAISLAQQTTMTGQIYAGGAISIGNNSNITFGSLDVWQPGASLDILGYRVETLYKRENVS